MLTVRGSQIVNGDGEAVVLRGFGLGGWMNMENFITGYPGNEQAQREAIRKVLGDDLYHLFFQRFLDDFFTEDDARFIRSLGLIPASGPGHRDVCQTPPVHHPRLARLAGLSEPALALR
jgi:hypothetical protein